MLHSVVYAHVLEEEYIEQTFKMDEEGHVSDIERIQNKRIESENWERLLFFNGDLR